MKRSLAVLAVAAVAMAVSVSLPASAGPRAHGAKLHKTTTFLELSDIHISDTDASGGASPGDILTYTETEFTKEGGKQIAKGHGYCVAGVAPFSTCTSVTTDEFGATVTIGENDSTARTNVFAVSGGTGRYARARGQSKVIAQGDPATATKFVIKARLYY